MANRIDLDERRVVKSKTGETFASENGFDYFETSAVSVIHIVLI